MNLLRFLATFLALFSPKFGLFDSKLLLIPIAGFFLVNYRLKKDKHFGRLLFVAFLIFVYSFYLYVIYPPDLEFLRYLRSFLSMIFLLLIFQKSVSPNSILSIILFCLSIHALSIYISIIFPSFQYLLANLYDTRVVLNRYSGLTAGYDISGFFTICGFYISYHLFKQSWHIKNLFFLFLFFGATFFTSRTSMILIILFVGYFNVDRLINSEFSFKKLISLIIVFSGLTYIVFIYVAPILIATIQLDALESYQHLGNSETIYSYSKDDPFQLLLNYIILPDNFIDMLFGINNFPKSDSGYIQTINTIGLLGLSLHFIFHYLVYSRSRMGLFSRFLKFVLLMIFLLSIKNQYFFTRGVFELLIILHIVNRSSNTYKQTSNA